MKDEEVIAEDRYGPVIQAVELIPLRYDGYMTYPGRVEFQISLSKFVHPDKLSLS